MKPRSPRNRTLICAEDERAALTGDLLRLVAPASLSQITDRVIHQDFFEACAFLPAGWVDLLILDPPYNRTKAYHGHPFHSQPAPAYTAWFGQMLDALLPLLAPRATVYVCSDWETSALIFPALNERLHVRNRITWERDKGRGARRNWKNNSEDIWFCTVGADYVFNLEAVKVRRRVIAPYRSPDGTPKDWAQDAAGQHRLTHPSNLWTDLTVPFWSMPENTDHPTQKPEKLLARLILASSAPGDFVFDPFLGSGTTAVVAKKLGRRYCGVEINAEYCCWAAKRLRLAETDRRIQGYTDGLFWERNSQPTRRRGR